MPAISPVKLKKQLANLAGKFDNPTQLTRSIIKLLEYYSERTYSPGHLGTPPSLLKSLNVSKTVIVRITQELVPLVSHSHEKGLQLIDELWQESIFETHLLAIYLLGHSPTKPSSTILDRVNLWADSTYDDLLITALATKGLNRLGSEIPDVFVSQLESWLASSKQIHNQLGLRALLKLISQNDLEHLPRHYQYISPFISSVPHQLKQDVISVIKLMTQKSPRETSKFLLHNLKSSQENDTAWIIRQVLDEFPVDIQNILRSALRPSDLQ